MNATTGPAATPAALTYAGRPLDTTDAGFGRLRPSADAATDGIELRRRLADDGYLYMPGLLPRDAVLAARRCVLERLASEGALDPAAPLEAGVTRPGLNMAFRPDLAMSTPAVPALVYGDAMLGFFERLLGGPVRHLDFTWMRAKAPGSDTATHPHCDIVYMSRGTPNLLTAWTPLGDVPFEMGGLMLLEQSHRRADLLATYWQVDVDSYCSNGPEAAAIETGQRAWESTKQGGAFDYDAVHLSTAFGSRWLSTEYTVGDVLVFGMHTMHASSDNLTNRIRLSTDSRYQLASEPADPRWIGPNPIAHGPKSKVANIC